MSKEKNRGNREIKKPKKEKIKVSATANSGVKKSRHRDRRQKGKLSNHRTSGDGSTAARQHGPRLSSVTPALPPHRARGR